MSWEVREGHALEVLRTLPDESVHCTVTSPPYFGLRDYDLPPMVWGPGPDCDHEWGQAIRRHKGGARGPISLPGGSVATAEAQARVKTVDGGCFCAKCGAWLGSLGLEPSPGLYVEHVVEVMREVRRALRPDGTLWLNLGDCYATRPRGNDNGWDKSRLNNPARLQKAQAAAMSRHRSFDGLKSKELVGIPWRVAFALSDDGWWLRKAIVWYKGNPTPESVLDRPTSTHEYIFLLSRNGRRPLLWRARDTLEWTRKRPDTTEMVMVWDAAAGAERSKPRWRGFDYYFDAEVVREPYTYGRDHHRNVKLPPDSHMPGAPRHSGLRQGIPYRSGNGFKRPQRLSGGLAEGSEARWEADGRGRNLRDVWEIEPEPESEIPEVWKVNTVPFPEAHYAVFPRELPRRCILAGSPGGGLVADPFCGSGTTGVVAHQLGRDFVGVELSPTYAEMSRRRIEEEGAGVTRGRDGSGAVLWEQQVLG